MKLLLMNILLKTLIMKQGSVSRKTIVSNHTWALTYSATTKTIPNWRVHSGMLGHL